MPRTKKYTVSHCPDRHVTQQQLHTTSELECVSTACGQRSSAGQEAHTHNPASKHPDVTYRPVLLSCSASHSAVVLVLLPMVNPGYKVVLVRPVSNPPTVDSTTNTIRYTEPDTD